MQHLNRIAELYKSLQQRACTILEDCDGGATFTTESWKKDIGSGITRVISAGNAIEKGAINFSYVSGKLNPFMAQSLGVEGETYAATGVSSIFHANNPFVPTIHMNVRYFVIDNGTEWFGGGIDLTPMYIDTKQAKSFHLKLKEICDKFNPEFYPEFKNWADDYFFIEHRNETRGVGGIFFDRQVPGDKMNIEKWIEFTTKLTESYPEIYAELIQENSEIPFTQQHKEWQKIRRGRYVEFNLVYDRGTKFGLASGGNTESILVSLPPEVNWEYKHQPIKGSEEEKTLNLLKKGIDRIN